MPLYVYSCPECEIELEELRPAARSDEPVECPVCHGLCLREVSNFSFRSASPPDRSAAATRPTPHRHIPGSGCCGSIRR